MVAAYSQGTASSMSRQDNSFIAFNHLVTMTALGGVLTGIASAAAPSLILKRELSRCNFRGDPKQEDFAMERAALRSLKMAKF